MYIFRYYTDISTCQICLTKQSPTCKGYRNENIDLRILRTIIHVSLLITEI